MLAENGIGPAQLLSSYIGVHRRACFQILSSSNVFWNEKISAMFLSVSSLSSAFCF